MIRAIFFLIVTTLAFSTTGLSCTLFGSEEAKKEATRPITLNYWRVFDDEDAISEIIKEYTKLHPNVSINYKKFRFEEYEKELIDALAEDRGPDLFSIGNTDTDKYLSKIIPMPTTIKVGYPVEKGTIQKRIEYEIRTGKGYTPQYMRSTFVETVGDDVMRGQEGSEQIYALPLAIDTLVMFYNRELLNNAGIAEPPTTWKEFTDQVAKLTTILHDTGDILQSGAAFGTANNVQRSVDILAALMMQNGAEMSRNGAVLFDRIPDNISDRRINPSVDALRFYTDFASALKEKIYTWNENQPDSLEAFAQGRAAFFFGYSYHAAQLKTKAPRLRIGVTPLPHIAGNRQVTTANYWTEVVSKKTKEQDVAWDFLMFATSKGHVESYLKKTGKPTALRALVDMQKVDDNLAPFAAGTLTATNWYHGKDYATAQQALKDMITEAITTKGGAESEERSKLQAIVGRAAQVIRSTY